MEEIIDKYIQIRKETFSIANPLTAEDCVVQPEVFVSPIKWHLAHTSWFFETFILRKYSDYKPFNKDYAFLFNSYYKTEGKMLIRANRGNLTRPSLKEINAYRAYIDDHIIKYAKSFDGLQRELLELGLNHEQQHQELMCYDLKYILGHNPMFPPYSKTNPYDFEQKVKADDWLEFKKQVYTAGHKGEGFCYDNEMGAHEVMIHDFSVRNTLVRNEEYLDFINDGGYENFNYWLSDGWDWINDKENNSPMYWYKDKRDWYEYTLSGLRPLKAKESVKHISFYEADAFARWKGCRLLTEFEWELASNKFDHGMLWEWTQSAYLPYPGFKIAEGAVGEYNGKFMINQKVLRGGSVASPKGHIRPTYRNFFQPQHQWMYSGIRLAK